MLLEQCLFCPTSKQMNAPVSKMFYLFYIINLIYIQENLNKSSKKNKIVLKIGEEFQLSVLKLKMFRI